MDDLVESVLNKIPDLDNTYVIFSSDHGYHMGQFGMTIDKRQLYEFDIREDISFTDIFFLKHACSILRQSLNPVSGFSMMEPVKLCAVWPMENWLGSSTNHMG